MLHCLVPPDLSPDVLVQSLPAAEIGSARDLYMDVPSIGALAVTAAFIGFFHTLAGPDHYLPFIAMSRAGRWSAPKTLAVTLVCGLGHVAGSVVLGGLGIMLGWAVGGLEWLESVRGDVAAWLLLGFGLAYMAWGIRRAIRNRPHVHVHAHAPGEMHAHAHGHVGDHAHAHTHEMAPGHAATAAAITPWALFTIFVFGPCEPLIPILMYPAAEQNWWGLLAVTGIFAVCTLVTMTAMVMLGMVGLARLSLGPLERYSHAMAGFALAACGVAIHMGL
jgi:nickel/cobalt transporter (NicO) family protein